MNVLAADQGCRPDYDLEALRETVGAYIADYEFALEFQVCRELRAGEPGQQALQVRPVWNDTDLFFGNTPLDQPLPHRIGNRNDALRAAIQPRFEAAENSHRQAFLHCSHSRDGFRPEVANLEHPRPPFRPTEEMSADSGQQLRRRRDNDIGVLRQARQKSGQRKTCEVERAQDNPPVGRKKTPDANHVDSVDGFPGEKAISVRRMRFSKREIWYRGDDSHMHALLHPVPAMLVRTAGRCVLFRYEVVGKKQDLHRIIGQADECEDAQTYQRPGYDDMKLTLGVREM